VTAVESVAVIDRAEAQGIDPQTFTALRPYLFSIAYRMLGSASDAEDVVQDAYLRMLRTSPKDIRSPKAYMSAVVTHLCLDLLAARKAERETYHGPWLPEPALTEDLDPGPETATESGEDISLAMLVLLERLTPEERATYVLREAFNYPYDEIAPILGKSIPATRQIAHRAHQHLADRPRFMASPREQNRLAERFLAAARQGDLPTLLTTLAADVTAWSDGGAKARAARRPICGRDAVARWITGLQRKHFKDMRATIAEINGSVGILLWAGTELVSVLVLAVHEGRIQALYAIVNPDKLCHLRRRLGDTTLVEA
jgi:RNA polymerase sigma-70 factor (TIGR02957 family)